MVEHLYIVGVCMITYNHELFIAAAIEGVMKQETNFSYHLYISDDCSTDNTRDICLEYKNKYPNRITLFEKQVNVGMSKNFTRTLEACDSKFIAICEGDDYWTDSHKLQKQVDFMEANSDYSLVYHRVQIFDETLQIYKSEENNLLDEEKTYQVNDLAVKNFIHTPSVLIRRSSIDLDILIKYKDILMDYFLWLVCAKSGKIKYLPDVMAVYRVWDGSVWELKDVKTKMYIWLPILKALLQIFSEDSVVYQLLFNQLNRSYRQLYLASLDQVNKDKLDEITKDLLLKVDGFQSSWFSYMIYLKKSRVYRLKYFFFLVRKKSLASSSFLKKCVY